MCEWDGVNQLGDFLGIESDDREPPGALDIVGQSLNAFGKQYSREVLEKIIFNTDFSRLPRDGDREIALARYVFGRLDPGPWDEEAFVAFNEHFRRFIRWFRVALDAVLHVHGFKKEPLHLDDPGARDYIEELRELPCRRPGELSFSNRMRDSAAVSRYIEAHLGKYEGNPIAPQNCRQIREIMGKVSGHPGYYRSLGVEQKLIEARPLLMAISELQLDPRKEPAKADMLAAMAILLFNIYPIPKLLKFIARLAPGTGNAPLQYDHCAILAMNYLLAGSLKEAAAYNEKALEFADDEEKRAYTHILDSCIRLTRGDTVGAINALHRCLALTKDRRTHSMVLFYMGIIHHGTGNVPEAGDAFRLAKAGLEDELDIMCAGANIGTCAMLLGDLNSAARELEDVVHVGQYLTGSSARALKAVTCGNLGLIYLSRNRYDRAINFFKDALRLNREAHNKKGVVDQLGNIGLALKAQREYRSALEYFKSALGMAFRDDYLEGALFAVAQVEQLLALDGRYEEAEAYRREMIRRNPGIARMLRL